MDKKHNILVEFIDFLKRPRYYDQKEALSVPFMNQVMMGFILVFCAEIAAMGLMQLIVPLDQIDHSLTNMLEDGSLFQIFLFAVFRAPLIEELIFRWPMGLFKNNVGFVFYGLTFIFAGFHAFNFDLSQTPWYTWPVLVLPQLILGLYLGFVRMKSNVGSSIIVHAYNNLIPIGFYLLAKMSGMEM